MADLFTISSEVRTIAQQGLDSLINQLGKTCRVYYPGIPTTNDIGSDPIGKKPGGAWYHGGPHPRPAGPLSGGNTKPSKIYEDVTLLLSWSAKKYGDFGQVVTTPGAIVQAKGYITDLPKIRNAIYFVLQPEILHYVNNRFVLNSEPWDESNIIQGRYFQCLLKRGDVD